MGKTEAAILPIFDMFLRDKENKEGKRARGISILYITPLRALNRDMLARLKSWCAKLNINIAVRHGDTSTKERIYQSKNPPDMLITTPETFQIMFLGTNLREHLKTIRWVIIDEIHELANDERGAQLSITLERLYDFSQCEFQRVGLSATINNPNDIAKFMAGVGRNVAVVTVPMRKDIKITVECPRENKDDTKISKELEIGLDLARCIRRCKEIIEKRDSTLLFTNTRDGAEVLTTCFKRLDESYPIGIHHGSLSRDIRIEMEDAFKGGKLKSLICTSSLELGIDVGSTDFIIQYNSPRDTTRLVQRIGRSGHTERGVASGTVITTSPDEIFESTVIVKRTITEKLEPIQIRENPLTVLANQLIAFTMYNKKCNISDVLQVIRRAHPFRNLQKDVFMEVLKQLRDIGLIWADNEMFGKRRNAMTYFYENISMIPDERKYNVVDITTRKHIGTLDESFVMSYVASSFKFIVSGRVWSVVDINDEDILVEPSASLGAVPSWIGEDIPVSFDVAQDVGTFRAKILEINKEKDVEYNKKRKKELMEEYAIDEQALRVLSDYVRIQDEKHPTPTDKLIVFESGNRLAILNVCSGTKVNETVGIILSALLSSKYGIPINAKTDAYRIILEAPTTIRPDDVLDILTKTNPETLRSVLRLILKNSQYIKWQLIHTAHKFGVLTKNVDNELTSVSRILEVFEETPLYDETIERIMWERMDIERTASIFKQIRDKKIEISITGLSPIGLSGHENIGDAMFSTRVQSSILTILKNRLENNHIHLMCVKCKHSRKVVIRNVEDNVKCIKCGSVLVAAIYPDDERSIELLNKKKGLSESEKRTIRKMYTTANLVMSHGKRALLALAARGVGPETAARILFRWHGNEYDFLKDILSAEANYARTKRFWN
jgi:ATP-dependent Lhr-like helicase